MAPTNTTIQACPHCSNPLTDYSGVRACLTCGYVEPTQTPTDPPVVLPSVTPIAQQAPLQVPQAAVPQPQATAAVQIAPAQYTHLPVPPSMYPSMMAKPDADTGTPPVDYPQTVEPHEGDNNVPVATVPTQTPAPALDASEVFNANLDATAAPSHRRRYKLAAIAVVAALIIGFAGVLGYSETTAHNALKMAQTKLDNGQYGAALDIINKVNPPLALGGTKKQLQAMADKASRWEYEQAMLADAEKSMQEGNYEEALSALQSIDHNFPNYRQVKSDLQKVNQQIALAKKKAAPETPAVVATEPTPSPTPQPYHPPVTKKPTPTPSPSPTPTPTPPPDPPPVVVTPNPTPPPGETD